MGIVTPTASIVTTLNGSVSQLKEPLHRGSAWINPSTHEPTLKNIFLNAKNLKKVCTGMSSFSMCVHEVS